MAIDICPDYEIAWNNIGNAYDKMGKHAEAQKYHDKSLELKPDFDYALYAKGYGMAKLGDIENGLEYIEQSLDLNPNYDHSWLAKAKVLGWLGRYEEALDAANNALLLNPVFDEAWQFRGEMFEKLGRFEESSYCYDRALAAVNETLARHPTNKDSLHIGTELMGTLKRYDELGVCCVNVIGREHTSDQKMTKARLLLGMGRFDELSAWLDVLSSECVSNWETHYLRARVHVARQEPLKALAELEQFAGKDAPPKSNMLRAEVLASLGKEAESLAALAIPNPDATVLKARGEVQLKFKRYRDAVDSFSRSLEMDPRCISAWHGKGMACLGNGQPDDAIVCFDTAIGLDRDYVWAWAGKVRAYRAKGDAKNAALAEKAMSQIDRDFRIE
jgi:tetratricopeptide (TPR) repeat protein